jgi:hypothetical protein
MSDSIIIDTPDGIAFLRALSRRGALKLGQPGVLAIVRDVYGLPGNKREVLAMLDEYIEGTLEVRGWDEARALKAQETAQEAMRRAEEEHGNDPRLKDIADSNVQAFFEAGSITEQEGNDACLLLFVEVIRQRAHNR